MGLYIEGIGNTVEEKLVWLNTMGYMRVSGRGKLKGLNDHESLVKRNRRFVCIVDNGHFQAIGVAFDQQELDRFNLETDDRMKVWYTMDIGTIKAHAPMWKDYKKELK